MPAWCMRLRSVHVRYRANVDEMRIVLEFLTRNCCGGFASCAATAALPARRARAGA